jgi:hypothetical protein
MTGNNEKKTVTIPVPAHYVTDTMIAGVKKEDLRTMWFGDFEMTVFFTDVPVEKAKGLLSLTWAEVDFDKPKRRRLKAGIKDCELTAEIECMIPSECFEDPLQLIIDKEAIEESRKLIDYLESIHKHYGEIFRERLRGTFSGREMERNLGVCEANIRRWNREITKLAMQYYFNHYLSR